jgi:hypothetical protein
MVLTPQERLSNVPIYNAYFADWNQTSRLLWAIYQCIPSTTVFYYVDQNELTGK